LRAIINPGWNLDQDIAPTLLLACASTLGAGLGNNSTLTVALATGVSSSEATKDALLDSVYLPGAITVGASAGLTTWFATNTLTQGAVLGARYIYLLFATKGCLVKGNGNRVTEVGTTLWSLTGSSGCPTKEGIENITKATEVKALKASSEKTLSTAVSKAVISSALFRVREHFISFIHLFELVCSPVIMVMVRMILEG
jgi:hypothetical protein